MKKMKNREDMQTAAHSAEGRAADGAAGGVGTKRPRAARRVARMVSYKIQSLNWGPIFVFLSGVTFSIGGICLKYIPWNPLATNSARNFLALLVVGFYMIITKHKFVINKHVIIGGAGLAATTTLFCLANKLTTAGNAIILQFTAPVWVMIFSAIFLRIRPNRIDIIAAIVVLAGVLLFFIDSIGAGNMLGNVIALISGMTYVCVFTMGSFDDSDSLSATMVGIIISIIIGIPSVIKADFGAMTTAGWVALLAVGLIEQGVSYIFLNLGLNSTSAIASSLISGVEPVLNPVWVALVYGEMLTPLSIVGAVIVLCSIVIYNVLKIKRQA